MLQYGPFLCVLGGFWRFLALKNTNEIMSSSPHVMRSCVKKAVEQNTKIRKEEGKKGNGILSNNVFEESVRTGFRDK